MIRIANLLRSKGLKVTPQRIAILNMLMNTKAHPTAETIFRTLEPANPTLSLATVYKTLDSFKEAGLIQILCIAGDSLHYDFNTDFHPHFVCKKCNAVMDIDVNISDEMSLIVNKVNDCTDYSIDNQQLLFYGICEECEKCNTQ